MSKTNRTAMTSDPLRSTFISPAFCHSKTAHMFGRVDKEGQVRELEPYQVRTLDEYIDIENLNQEMIQSYSSLGNSHIN